MNTAPQTQALPGKALSLAQALNTGSQLLAGGRVTEADQLLKQVVAARPDSPPALHLAGMIAFQAGRSQEGLALVERALELRPDMPDALYNLGKMLVSLARTEPAKKAFARVVEQRPDHVPAWVFLGNLLRGDGAFEPAIDAYRRALEIAPNDAATLINLAQALSSAGRDAEAETAARQAIALAPNSDAAHAGLGSILLRAGGHDTAVAAFTRAAKIDPTQPLHEINLAMAQHRLGRYQEAHDACDRILARHPRHTRALHYKGALLALLGRHELRARLLAFDRLIHESRIAPPPGGDLASFNRELVDAVLAHPTLIADPSTKSTRGGRQTADILGGATGVLGQFADLIRQAVTAYAKGLEDMPDHPMGGPAPAEFDLMGWATVLDQGGHQLSHFHPISWISGVYYPQVPATIAGEDAERAGWIAFGRPQDVYDVQGGSVERWFLPAEGKLILFPGWLGHRTQPFVADPLNLGQPRVSIAFDTLAR